MYCTLLCQSWTEADLVSGSVDRLAVGPLHVGLTEELRGGALARATSSFRYLRVRVEILRAVIVSKRSEKRMKKAYCSTPTYTRPDVVPPLRKRVLECKFANTLRVQPSHKLLHLRVVMMLSLE